MITKLMRNCILSLIFFFFTGKNDNLQIRNKKYISA